MNYTKIVEIILISRCRVKLKTADKGLTMK